jgi:anti-sigma factor RsiW
MTDSWTDRLSEYLDDELTPAERAGVDEHLRGCAGCRAVLEELRAVTLRAAALRDTPPRESLWPEVARRIGHPGAADELAGRRGRPRLPLRWAAGMAAVLALGIGIGRNLPQDAQPAPVAASPRTDPYRVAAVEHIARSQALLTSFQHSSADAQTEALVSHWANDLLSNTRLLLDSPAADDARVRRLLQDLELVLVQIAQLREGGAPRAEVDLARDAIAESGVLPRMRAVVPAAAPSTLGES